MQLLQRLFNYTLIPIFTGLIIGSFVALLWLANSPLEQIVAGAAQLYFLLPVPASLAVVWIDWVGRRQSPPVAMPLPTAITWTVWFVLVIGLMYIVGIGSFTSPVAATSDTDIFLELRAVAISWRLLVNEAIAVLLTIILRRLLASSQTSAAQ